VTALLGEPRDRELGPAHGKTFEIVRYQLSLQGMPFLSRHLMMT